MPRGALATAGSRAGKILRYLAVKARQRPLEATAVVLIGLGGAVYPPVWILGAVLALASRVWDFRDKWLGLVVPVFVVIVGMGADVSLGGTRSGVGAYFREAWIFGGHLSRVVGGPGRRLPGLALAAAAAPSVGRAVEEAPAIQLDAPGSGASRPIFGIAETGWHPIA